LFLRFVLFIIKIILARWGRSFIHYYVEKEGYKRCLEYNIIYFILLRNKLSLKFITNRDNTENISSLSNYYYTCHDFYGFTNAVLRICDCFMIQEKKSMFTIIFFTDVTYFNRNIRNDKLLIQIYNGTYTENNIK